MLNSTEPTIQMISIELIIPNRFQPRLSFDEQGLNELAASIKEHGIIQPLVLRKLADKYEIIAGERRYKAASIAGLTEVPAIITELDDDQSAEVALVENIQRRDLSAIEEAKSYKKILDRGQLTQEQLATKMGITQPTIANKLRLLNLDEDVQEALMNEKISERHARSLLQFSDVEQQKKMLHRIITERLTVRSLDVEIKKIISPNSDNLETVDESKIETLETEIETLETLDSEEVQTDESLNTEQQEMLEQLVDDVKIETLDFEEEGQDIEEIKEKAKDIEIVNKTKQTIKKIFDDPEYPSLEDEAANMNTDIMSTPGFNPFSTDDEINSTIEEETDLKEPEVAEVEPIPEEVEERIKENDLDSVKKAYRELEEEVKTAKHKITSEEFDFEDLYQIIIKIEKQVE